MQHWILAQMFALKHNNWQAIMYIPIHKVGQDLIILGLTHTHRWTQKLQNDQHLKIFHTYNFSSGYSILGMHMNINVIVVWLLTSYIWNSWHIWLPTSVWTPASLP